MGKMEARNIKGILDISEQGPKPLARALAYTSWTLDHPKKRISVLDKGKRSRMEVIECRTQRTRQKKGLSIFPCIKVRQGYLEEFAKEFGCRLITNHCPPDPVQDDVWCSWDFVNDPQSSNQQ